MSTVLAPAMENVDFGVPCLQKQVETWLRSSQHTWMYMHLWLKQLVIRFQVWPSYSQSEDQLKKLVETKSWKEKCLTKGNGCTENKQFEVNFLHGEPCVTIVSRGRLVWKPGKLQRRRLLFTLFEITWLWQCTASFKLARHECHDSDVVHVMIAMFRVV